jgi:hypothetical protein
VNNLGKKIEMLANVAIILVALLLGGVLVKRYLLPQNPSPQAQAPTQIPPGTKLSLPGVDWSKSNRTLLLVLSTDCRYCTESAPFYQTLAREKAKHQDTRLVAVLPQDVGVAQKYLGDHGISVDEIRQATPNALQARATPTLIITDREGAVIESWVGKLPPQEETKVLNRFFAEDRPTD